MPCTGAYLPACAPAINPADILAGEIHLLGTRTAELAEVTNVKDLEFFGRIAAYEAAFARSGHTNHDIVVFPGADHRILVPDPTSGQPRRAPGLYELIATWLARTL